MSNVSLALTSLSCPPTMSEHAIEVHENIDINGRDDVDDGVRIEHYIEPQPTRHKVLKAVSMHHQIH